MTLLRLSPDGERLRRIAKAHAAGELSTPSYRRIRSDVIEGFGDAAPDGVLTGDTTETRAKDHGVRPKRHVRAREATPIDALPRTRIVGFAIAGVLLAMLLGAVAVWGRSF